MAENAKVGFELRIFLRNLSTTNSSSRSAQRPTFLGCSFRETLRRRSLRLLSLSVTNWTLRACSRPCQKSCVSTSNLVQSKSANGDFTKKKEEPICHAQGLCQSS